MHLKELLCVKTYDGDGDGVKGTTRVQRPRRYQFDVDGAMCALPGAQYKVSYGITRIILKPHKAGICLWVFQWVVRRRQPASRGGFKAAPGFGMQSDDSVKFAESVKPEFTAWNLSEQAAQGECSKLGQC